MGYSLSRQIEVGSGVQVENSFQTLYLLTVLHVLRHERKPLLPPQSDAVRGVLCFICVISFRPLTTRWKHGQKCIEQIVKDFSLIAFSENNELLFVVLYYAPEYKYFWQIAPTVSNTLRVFKLLLFKVLQQISERLLVSQQRIIDILNFEQ